jgi:DNA-binding MarR family transcriptional regulator
MSQSYDFAHAPGHLIRRAQQVAVALFADQLAAFDVTPVQFALMNALIDTPGTDQVTLAARVALDAATSGSVISRLEAKGWIRREASPQDRRRKLLWLTTQGKNAVMAMAPQVAEVQSLILQPLTAPEQQQFLDLLAKLVNAQSSN